MSSNTKMINGERQAQHEKININEIFRKLSAKWYYFVISLVILVPLAGAYLYFTQNTYLIRASILLNGELKNGLNSEKFLKGMELMSSQTEIEDEVGILKSFSLSESTIQKLDFGITYYTKSYFRSFERYGSNYPFQIELDSTVNQMVDIPVFIKRINDTTYSVKAQARNAGAYNFYTGASTEAMATVDIDATQSTREVFKEKDLSFQVRFSKSYFSYDEDEYYFVIHNLGKLAEAYRQQLEIKPISRDANMVEVNLKVKNPDKGVRMLNTLLEVYRTNELTKKNQLGLKTIRFIDDQLEGVSDELRIVENSLESFRSRNNILDINTTSENLTMNLDRLEADKSLLEQKLKYYEYIARSLEKDSDPKHIDTPSTFGLEDPLLNNLLMELTRLNQERIGLHYGTTEGNPVAQVLELKITSTKRALAENVSNFIAASSQALVNLKSRISNVRANVQGLPRSERELVSIKRRFDFNDNVYNYLLEKRAEAGIAIASNTVEKTIVDKARLVGNGPMAPNKTMILLASVLLGLAFSVGLIIFQDVINDNIISQKDIEKNTVIPTIGTITHASKKERAAVIVASARTAIGESFRSLRVNLQYLTLGSENHVIGVTSSVEGEGKTFCSVNLAVTMAQSGKKTIIIDADMRRPKIAASFRLKNERGLSSFLIGSFPLKDVISATGTKGLDAITSGPIPPNPLDLIGLQRMEDLITILKQTYNTIIIDSPPLGYVSEYIILMKYTNANLYVVRSNFTSKFQLERINRLYEEKKIKNVSILLNDVKMSSQGYNYVYG